LLTHTRPGHYVSFSIGSEVTNGAGGADQQKFSRDDILIMRFPSIRIAPQSQDGNKTLGLTVPLIMQMTATDVIEEPQLLSRTLLHLQLSDWHDSDKVTARRIQIWQPSAC
jgi:hypothetical protein